MSDQATLGIDPELCPRLVGCSVGVPRFVIIVSVAVVGELFGAFAVVLAAPAVSVVSAPIDVLVLAHQSSAAPARRGRVKSAD